MFSEKFSFDEAQKIVTNQALRRSLSKESHRWFFHMYFPHYIEYPIAPFQEDIFELSEDENSKIVEIISFRNSSKSTLMTMSYPIWAIIGKQQKKFVVIISQTQEQSKLHLINIKRELEGNNLLKLDLGPFEESTDEWGSYSLSLPWYDAKIIAVSIGQTIRGMRYKQHRPDLVICDDLEDLASVKTKENRDKIYNELTGEVFPAGAKNTKYVIVGNLLHQDSVIVRIKNNIEQGLLNGKVLEIPLINEDGEIAWPGKFPDKESIEREKQIIGNEISWQREYMLKILPEEGQVIHLDWIKTYDQIEHDPKKFRYTVTGIDPAASEKDHADYTAAVSARVYGYGDELRIYILPNPLNKKLAFPKAVEELKSIYHTKDQDKVRRMLVEGFGYQKVLAQRLKEVGIPAEEVTPMGNDKRARLLMTSQMINDGKILFPQHGTEELINQIVYFGSEKHDDLVDAFTLVIFKILEESKKPVMPEIFWM